jgi:hypothetical protein
MKGFLLCLAMAPAIIVAAMTVSPVHAQQADQNPASTAPQKSDSRATPPQHPNEPQMPASGQATTEETQSFLGRVVKENGNLAL